MQRAQDRTAPRQAGQNLNENRDFQRERLAIGAAEPIDDAWYRVWRRGDDREPWREGEGFDAAVAGLSQEDVAAWIMETSVTDGT
jgi:hypothetical protein